MLKISNRIMIPDHEIEQQFIRSQGAGGQHVNKTSTAVHLFFDIRASTALPAYVKHKLLNTADHRISASGKIIIKSQGSRSQDSNRQTALEQLTQVIQAAMVQEKRRIATKPTKGSKTRRLDTKNQKGQTKKLRSKVQGVWNHTITSRGHICRQPNMTDLSAMNTQHWITKVAKHALNLMVAPFF